MAGRKPYERNLENYIDKGNYYWEDYFELLRETGAGRISLILQKGLHPDMCTEEGYTRVETWQEGKKEDAEKFKANVKYDILFVIFLFSERFKELGWIDGAFFAKDRMLKFIDMIQDDHSKEKDKEVKKALREAAEALVRSGRFETFEEAMVFVSTTPENGNGNKGRSKAANKDGVAV